MLLVMKILLVLLVFTIGFIAGTVTQKKLIESRNTKVTTEEPLDDEIYGDIPNLLRHQAD